MRANYCTELILDCTEADFKNELVSGIRIYFAEIYSTLGIGYEKKSYTDRTHSVLHLHLPILTDVGNPVRNSRARGHGKF